MGDRVDDLMAKHWAKLQAQISSGLKLDPKIDKFVQVSRSATPGPYRVMSPRMEPGRMELPTPGSDDPAQAAVRKFRPLGAVEGAYELTIDYELPLSAFEATIEGRMEELGKEARMAERRAFLALLDGPVLVGLDSITLTFGIEHVGRPCRLIAALPEGDNGEPDLAVMVDDHIDPGGALEDGVVGVLIPLVNGPKLIRVVDDLTTTWKRLDDESISLQLSERFFLDNPEKSIKFTW